MTYSSLAIEKCIKSNYPYYYNSAKINNNEAVFCSVNKADKVTGIRLSCIDVAKIVKKHSAKIDFDTSKIAGHSLRHGFVITAVSSGIRNHIIMKTTRHKSSKMIDDYTHDHSLLENNATNRMITPQSPSKKFVNRAKNKQY